MSVLRVLLLRPWSRIATTTTPASKLAMFTRVCSPIRAVSKSSQQNPGTTKEPLKKPKTPQGRFDETEQSNVEKDPLQRFPNDLNPVTKEKGGPRGPEPTRYGDWERKGRCIDF